MPKHKGEVAEVSRNYPICAHPPNAFSPCPCCKYHDTRPYKQLGKGWRKCMRCKTLYYTTKEEKE